MNDPVKFIHKVMNRQLTLAEKLKIERYANHLIGLSNGFLEDETAEFVGHVLYQAAAKGSLTILWKSGQLKKDSVDHEEFFRLIEMFAYELLSEMSVRWPSAVTDKLRDQWKDAYK